MAFGGTETNESRLEGNLQRRTDCQIADPSHGILHAQENPAFVKLLADE